MNDMQELRMAIKEDIAELAGMISNNFTRIDERFQRVDNRFEKIDEQFQEVGKQFKEIDEQFREIGEQFQEVRENFRKVRGDILQLDQRFPTAYAFDRLSQRVVFLEEKIVTPSKKKKK